ARNCHECPLPSIVTTWKTAPEDLAPFVENAACPIDGRPLQITGASSLSHQPSPPKHTIPHFVEVDLSRSRPKSKDAKLGLAVTRLGVAEHHLLDLVGHHPFLPIDAIANVLALTPG